MVNKTLNARLGAIQTVDNAVGLWTYLKSIWNTATGYTGVPDYGVAAADITKIKFDTKFGSQKGFFNFVVIENMPEIITPQTLGGERDHHEDTKRIQIMCLGKSAKNNRWLMEKHIDSLLNGNKTGMQTTYGIDEMVLSEFVEIPVQSDSNITQLMPTKIDQSRSRATVTLKYDNYATTA